MPDSLTYLDTYILQQDMRIRMPKAILTNMGIEQGKTMLDIYFNPSDRTLVLKVHQDTEENL